MRVTLAAPLLAGLVLLTGCSKKAPAPVSLKGKVVFADGKPVANMILSLHPDDEATKHERLQSVVLPAEGTFEFTCLPGRYKATLGPIPKGAGDATAGPGTAPPPPPPGSTAPTTSTDPKIGLLARCADVSKTPLVVEVPASGAADLVLTVK